MKVGYTTMAWSALREHEHVWCAAGTEARTVHTASSVFLHGYRRAQTQVADKPNVILC
mgnify:CR=1 FL=1